MKTYDYYIGIDPGVNTGCAVWSKEKKSLVQVETATIHKVMEGITKAKTTLGYSIFVRFEDARQRRWLGEKGREALQGAGSIKRDCKIWEDFLKDLDVDFEMVPPGKGKTKWTDDLFRKVTGWTGRTSNHARDAAMLVFGS